MLFRGVPNQPKLGVTPLEGMVEADWYTGGVHIVWQLIRPAYWIKVAQDEPIVMIVPQRRGDLEGATAELGELADAPEIEAEYRRWRARRMELTERVAAGPAPRPKELDLDYYKGPPVSGCPALARAHRMRLELPPFGELK